MVWPDLSLEGIPMDSVKKTMMLLAIVAGGALCGPALAQAQAVPAPQSKNSSPADAPSQNYLKFAARRFSVDYSMGEPVFVDLQVVNLRL